MPGIDAFGTVLARGDGGSPEAFTPVANAMNPTAPGYSRETYDVTAHNSPGKFREFVGGLHDGGEVTCDLNFKSDLHIPVFQADRAAEAPVSYRLAWPDGSRVDYKAILTGFEQTNPHDGKAEASATWKVTGEPIYTLGA